MTLGEEIGELALIPGEGGVFVIRLNGIILFSRDKERRFPESKEIKQLIRDQIAPEKPLGHSDNGGS